MYPESSTLYSTNNGTSFDILKLTVLLRGVALVKFTKYLRENVRLTLDCNSITVSIPSSFSEASTAPPCFKVTDPAPRSPDAVNLTPSLVQSITTYGTEKKGKLYI